ncbi:AlpA family transcriptional regulator [Nitrosospira sp. Nsp2]|uniref:helix-turn-helix transcriptional regulator n=1 Tax=Nitrosospira sp. Nsp2 TaxID=136548 RepID=UPI000D325DC1|nr:AlpA family phage regulatory protein [Nitrosospira sp. Nsp2]PTR16973.1 AlpA family transcriptional regulator [Nitrosospira sp. Nsp2]
MNKFYLNYKNPPQTGYIRASRLAPSLDISEATLWRWTKNGTFPAPARLSARVTAWSIKDVEAWLKSKMGDE